MGARAARPQSVQEADEPSALPGQGSDKSSVTSAKQETPPYIKNSLRCLVRLPTEKPRPGA